MSTLLRQGQIDEISKEKLERATFITPVDKKGKELTIFGKAASDKYLDTWRTAVEIDGNPFERRIGFFGGTIDKAFTKEILASKNKDLVIVNSPEEVSWKAKINQQIQSEKKQLLALLLSQNPEGSISNGMSFMLDFTGVKPESKQFIGKIKLINEDSQYDAVQKIQGNISDDELNFTSTKTLAGKDNPNYLGYTYTFPLAGLSYDKVSNSNEIILDGHLKKSKKGNPAKIVLKNANIKG